MPASMIRKSIWGVTALVLLAILVVAALPLIASTQLVRDRIALEMTALTGYQVKLAAAPDIRIWPTFKAVVDSVSLSEPDQSELKPVLDAERVEIELSAIAALRGNVEIESVRLVRPTLYVSEISPDRYAPAAPRIGRIWSAVERARTAVAEDSVSPKLTGVGGSAFGTIEFSDGQIVDLAGGKGISLVTGISGAVEWDKLDRGASLSASGVWRGENFKVEAASDRPLLLFAGGPAPLSVRFNAAPVSASFEGSADLFDSPFFNGQLTFNSPSLRRMLEWSRSEVPPGATSGSVALSGKLSGDRVRLKLDEAQVTLDGNPGSGLLEISLADKVPAITGTLAFNQLDLRTFVSAFTPFTSDGGGAPSAIDLAFAEKYNLDLRLSAANATAGDLSFEDVAATAQVRGGLSAFDISDATIFGGTLQAGMRYDRKGDGGDLEVRILADGIDSAPAMALAKSARISPSGKASISLMLKGPGRDRDSFLRAATGSFSMIFGPGSVNGFDIVDFINHVRQGGFFPLTDIASSTLSVDRAEVRATLAEGSAKLEKAEANLGDRSLVLTGIVPYAFGGLALSGAVVPADQAADDPDATEATFFVGGPWNTPYLSPSFSGMSFDRQRVGTSE